MYVEGFKLPINILLASRRGKVEQAKIKAHRQKCKVTEETLLPVIEAKKQWKEHRNLEWRCFEALVKHRTALFTQFKSLMASNYNPANHLAERRVQVLFALANRISKLGFFRHTKPRNDFSTKFSDYRFMAWIPIDNLIEDLGFDPRRHVALFRKLKLISAYQASNHKKDTVMFYAFNWDEVAKFLGLISLHSNVSPQPRKLLEIEIKTEREIDYSLSLSVFKYIISRLRKRRTGVMFPNKQKTESRESRGGDILSPPWEKTRLEWQRKPRNPWYSGHCYAPLFMSLGWGLAPTAARVRYFMAAVARLRRGMGLSFRAVVRGLAELWREEAHKFRTCFQAFNLLLRSDSLEEYCREKIIDYKGYYSGGAWRKVKQGTVRFDKPKQQESYDQPDMPKLTAACNCLPDDIKARLVDEECVALAASWLAKCTFGDGIIFAPNNFMRDYIEKNVLDRIAPDYQVQLAYF
jgi:hypothetical protein